MSNVANVVAGAALVMAAGGIAVAATLSEPEPPRIGDPVEINTPVRDETGSRPGSSSTSPDAPASPTTGPRGTDDPDDPDDDFDDDDLDDDLEVVRPSPRALDDDGDDDPDDDADDRDDSRDRDD
jgi:hypothetical protein